MIYSDYPDLVQLLARTVSDYGDLPAFSFKNRKISYKEFWKRAVRFASALAGAGINRGDRVALMLPNIPEFPIVYYGTILRGAIAVPLNIMFKSHEARYIVEDCEAKALIIWDKVEQQVGEFSGDKGGPLTIVFEKSSLAGGYDWEDFLTQYANSDFEPITPDLNDTAVILYTSGTTGHPKGAELTHLNLASNAIACVKADTLTPNDVVLGVLPFYHSFGQTVVMNACIASGAQNVLLPKFEPALVLEAFQEHEVTIFAAVPTMFKLMSDFQTERISLPMIRTCISGAAKLDMHVAEEFEEKFGLPIYEGYGLTEASPVVSFNPMDYRSKPGSVGLPVSDVEIQIVDEQGRELKPGQEGEIIVRGPNVMKGYLNRPEATKEVILDGWLFTSDIGKIDDDGYLYILDRKREMIIKGGFNIYPKEVENVISFHPKIQEVAVVGVPDPVQGEEVKAYVVTKTGKKVSRQELFEYCQEHMAYYKCPKYITFLRSLPKSSSGRILKRKLYHRKPRKR